MTKFSYAMEYYSVSISDLVLRIINNNTNINNEINNNIHNNYENKTLNITNNKFMNNNYTYYNNFDFKSNINFGNENSLERIISENYVFLIEIIILQNKGNSKKIRQKNDKNTIIRY
jgi:hypothetical protein